MNLQQIHDMSADALAGEELQFCSGNWQKFVEGDIALFHSTYHWRIKPTIEVNGVMMSEREAKAAWVLSDATSFGCRPTGGLMSYTPYYCTPNFTSGMSYRWETPKWIYVNGEKVVPHGGGVWYMGYAVADRESGVKLSKAIAALVEIK